jgi:dTDP-4-dehydrorhamnose reductase
VQISTISSRCQLDHPYGINRFCAENLVLASSPDALVFRLGALYGEGLDKGVLFDMFSGNKVFLHGDSAYNYLSTTKAAKLMARQLPKTGIVEIGARDQITLKAIAEHFRLKVKFGKRVENLYTENPLSTYPRAKEVLDFVAAQKKK